MVRKFLIKLIIINNIQVINFLERHLEIWYLSNAESQISDSSVYLIMDV